MCCSIIEGASSIIMTMDSIRDFLWL